DPKNPLTLKESLIDPSAETQKGITIAAEGSANGVSVNLGGGSYYTFANNKFECKKVTTTGLANIVERFLDRPVVDLTELKGVYDIVLPVSAEDYQGLLLRAAVNSGVQLPPQML